MRVSSRDKVLWGNSREVVGKFKVRTSPIKPRDEEEKETKSDKTISKWIKCTSKNFSFSSTTVHVVEFGGSCWFPCSRTKKKHFFTHKNPFTRFFIKKMSSFLFYLQGCCSMYMCACIINGRCGICRNWCTRRRCLRSGARPLGKE